MSALSAALAELPGVIPIELLGSLDAISSCTGRLSCVSIAVASDLSIFAGLAEIRAVLGVSDLELSDATLSLPLYYRHLLSELDGLGLTLADDYKSLSQLLSPTSEQARFVRATAQFSVYAVAKYLTGSLPNFAPKQIGDGKASMTRHLDAYRAVTEQVETQYALARKQLIVTYAAAGFNSAATAYRVPAGLFVSRPDYNPVTGATGAT